MDTAITQDLAAVARIDSIKKILEVVCRTTGLGFSAVARVSDAHWIACAVRDEIGFGLVPGGELSLTTTICDSIRCSGDPVVIEHVAEDPVYKAHPTPQMYGFQSYASFPIRLPDGQFFGTLCAIDPRPARLKTPAITSMFTMFADLIGMQLQANDRMAASEAALVSEREASQLREQFIAVLGHDLRNPLGAISSSVEVLRMTITEPEDIEVLDIIERSGQRMSDLINDVVDFARSRLGSGLTLALSRQSDVCAAIEHVAAELRSRFPSRTIDTHLQIDRSFACDCRRLAQMLSNLLANALTHGDPSSPVRVAAKTTSTDFELSVANRGKVIPPEIAARLFQPFVRGEVRKGQEGLGLGLYIATEIARAHQGHLSVSSTVEETRFTFRMPIPAETTTPG